MPEVLNYVEEYGQTEEINLPLSKSEKHASLYDSHSNIHSKSVQSNTEAKKMSIGPLSTNSRLSNPCKSYL